jgi:hypothetical protein
MVASKTGVVERIDGELTEGNAALSMHSLPTGFVQFKNVVNIVQNVNFLSHHGLYHCQFQTIFMK